MKKIVTLMSALVLVLGCSVMMVACGGKALKTPNVTVNTTKASVSWGAVSKAGNYTIKIGSDEFNVTGTTFAFEGNYPAGSYTIQVRANPTDAKKHSASAYSASKTVNVRISYDNDESKIKFMAFAPGPITYGWELYTLDSVPTETGNVAALPGDKTYHGGANASTSDLEPIGTVELYSPAAGWYGVEIFDENDDSVKHFYIFEVI